MTDWSRKYLRALRWQAATPEKIPKQLGGVVREQFEHARVARDEHRKAKPKAKLSVRHKK